MIHWQRVKHFSPNEFQDPDEQDSGKFIDGVTLLTLEKLRIETGWPIIPHWQVGGCVDVHGTHGHSEGSYHLADKGCKAVDFHFQTKAPARAQIHEVLKSGFTGIGIYYAWVWKGSYLNVGFHVDSRPVERTQVWKREAGEYIFLIK